MKFRSNRSRTTIVVVTAIATVVALAGIAGAADSNANPKLSACYAKKSGAMRLVTPAKKCKKGEKRTSWNMKGIRGMRGLAGAQGAPGAAGKQGAQGPKGDRGPSNAFHDRMNVHTPIDDGGAIVAQVSDLPAGSYVFNFTADYKDGAGGGVLDCVIYGSGGAHVNTTIEVDGGRRTNVAMTSAASFQNAIDLMVICDDNNGDETLGNVHLTAIQVGTLTDV